MTKAYKALVEAVQSLCLASADDGTGPDEEKLHGVLKPLARAIMAETVHMNICDRPHESNRWR
jgi:hypothetical protein